MGACEPRGLSVMRIAADATPEIRLSLVPVQTSREPPFLFQNMMTSLRESPSALTSGRIQVRPGIRPLGKGQLKRSGSLLLWCYQFLKSFNHVNLQHKQQSMNEQRINTTFSPPNRAVHEREKQVTLCGGVSRATINYGTGGNSKQCNPALPPVCPACGGPHSRRECHGVGHQQRGGTQAPGNQEPANASPVPAVVDGVLGRVPHQADASSVLNLPPPFPPQDPIEFLDAINDLSEACAGFSQVTNHPFATTFSRHQNRDLHAHITEAFHAGQLLESGAQPFCGLGCLAIAMRVPLSPALIRENINVALREGHQIGDPMDVQGFLRMVPNTLGDSRVLGLIAEQHGYNFVLMLYQDGVLVEHQHSRSVRNRDAETIVLVFTGENGRVGHYQLLTPGAMEYTDRRPEVPLGSVAVGKHNDLVGVAAKALTATGLVVGAVSALPRPVIAGSGWVVAHTLGMVLSSIAHQPLFGLGCVIASAPKTLEIIRWFVRTTEDEPDLTEDLLRFTVMERVTSPFSRTISLASGLTVVDILECHNVRNPTNTMVCSANQSEPNLNSDGQLRVRARMTKLHWFSVVQSEKEFVLSAVRYHLVMNARRTGDIIDNLAFIDGVEPSNSSMGRHTRTAAAAVRPDANRTDENVDLNTQFIAFFVDWTTLASPLTEMPRDGPVGFHVDPDFNPNQHPVFGGRLVDNQPANSFGAPPTMFYTKNERMITVNARQRLGAANTLTTKSPWNTHVYGDNAKPLERTPPQIVAGCPLGLPSVDGGNRALGCGIFPTAGDETVSQAFLRSAGTHESERGLVKEFVSFSRKEIDRLLRDPELTAALNEMQEIKDVEEAYRLVYRDKISSGRLEADLQLYRKFKEGALTRREKRKFLKKTVFVKFESNNKGSCGRPRMIMQMCLKEKMEACQIVLLYHAYSESRSGQSYQVKGLSEEDFRSLVESLTSGEHYVTDMSSFEASISPMIRVGIEKYFMDELCRKSDFRSTNEALAGLTKEYAILHASKFKMSIGTRCSGNFETSICNGLINHCLILFAWHKSGRTGRPPLHVCEGDDGIVRGFRVDAELMGRLGFAYSLDLSGTHPGKVDFLSVRFISGHRVPDIFKTCARMFWAYGAGSLRKSKQLFLLRAKAYSAYMLYGTDLPIIGPLIVELGRLTSGASAFKTANRFLDTWHGVDAKTPMKDFPRSSTPTLEMRIAVDTGASGFPPIPISIQLLSERMIRNHDWSFFTLLTNWPSAEPFLKSGEYINGPQGVTAPLNRSNEPENRYSFYLDIMDVVGANTSSLRTVRRRDWLSRHYVSDAPLLPT